MNIGFDLDKVLINYPPLIPDRVIEKLYKKKANGTLLYRIPSTPEQWVRKMSHFSPLRRPVKNNLLLLKKLSRKNHLYLISSRFKFLEPETTKLLKKHRLDSLFDGMYFNYQNQQPHEFKEQVLKKLHLDAYVDDDYHLLNYVAKHQKATTLYWLATNKHEVSPNPNIKTIHELSEMTV